MMNQYPNKYTKGPGGAVNPAAHAAAERVRNILLILLVAAVVVLGIVGGKAISFRSKCEPTFIAQMKMECDEAISSVKALRQRGITGVANIGKIRGNIQAIEALNEVNYTVSANGYLVEPKVFANLYGIIDAYNSDMAEGGMLASTNENNLRNALNDLQVILEQLPD